MTQKEFEERTKLKVTGEQFREVHDTYMACGDDVDKDAFCDMYMDADGRLTLIGCLTEEVQKLNVCIEQTAEESDHYRNQYMKEAEEMEREKMLLAALLLEKSDRHGDRELAVHARKLVGDEMVVQIKLEKNLPLNFREREYLLKKVRPEYEVKE